MAIIVAIVMAANGHVMAAVSILFVAAILSLATPWPWLALLVVMAKQGK